MTTQPPRLKIYSAESGYVYHYYVTAREDFRFHFEVSADRRAWKTVSVILDRHALADWEAPRERKLSAQERYAIAKLALFAAFDAGDSPAALAARIQPTRADIDAIAARLDL